MLIPPFPWKLHRPEHNHPLIKIIHTSPQFTPGSHLSSYVKNATYTLQLENHPPLPAPPWTSYKSDTIFTCKNIYLFLNNSWALPKLPDKRTDVSVEITDEAELESSHIGVPAGIHLATKSAAHMGIALAATRKKLTELEYPNWQNCYAENSMLLCDEFACY